MRTRRNRAYAVSIWKVSVVATEILKNEAKALCLEMGMIARPIVISQRCPVKAIAASR
jgi:hypothetical protein